MNPQHPRDRAQAVKVIDGHSFYKIDFADEILHTRFMVAEVQELYIRAGISQDFLESISQLIIDRALDAHDLKKFREEMIAVGQNLKGRLGMIADMAMYEELACVYFMMDDEPAEYLADWQIKKKEVWKNERDFFLSTVFALINGSEITSTSDILAVFQAVKERLQQLPTLPQ